MVCSLMMVGVGEGLMEKNGGEIGLMFGGISIGVGIILVWIRALGSIIYYMV